MMLQKYKNPKTKQSKRRVLLVAALAAVVVAGGVLTWLYVKNNRSDSTPRPANTVDYNPPSQQEKDETEKQKEEIIKNATKGSESDTPTETSSDISVEIVRVTNATASQPLSVRTLVVGTSTGTCTATFSKSGQSNVTKDFPVVFEATSASCDGMDIPASTFPASGEWTMNLVVKSGSKTSAAVTRTVQVTKG